MEQSFWPEGLKHTKQREDVFDVLIHATEPMTAIEIFHHIENVKRCRSYAVSTIYRILAAFEEKGCVDKTTMMGEDMAVYAWRKEDHKHYAICLSCHKLIPLKECPFQHSFRLNEPQEDFVITGHKLELYGYCKECNEKRKHS